MIELPIEMLEPTIVHGLGNAGYFRHHRDHLPPSLIIDWDGHAYCFYLEGEHGNKFFKIDQRNSARGTLVRNPHFVVDIDSAFDATTQWDPPGALVIANGCANIVGCQFGRFEDPVRVPLWVTGLGGSQREAVGFKSWKLVVTRGDVELELWRQLQVTQSE